MNRTGQIATIDLSIVIVTFNNADIICSCCNALAEHLDGIRVQLVIVDNASSDDTPSMLKKIEFSLSGHFDITIQLNRKNIGYTRGVNQGIKTSRGDFILILNPDVIVTSSLPLILKRFQKDKRIGVLAPQLRYPDGRIQPSCRRFPRRRDVLYECMALTILFPQSPRFNSWRMPDFDHKSVLDNCQPQGAFLLTSRKVIEHIGLFDERFTMFFSDVDWCRRVIDAGFIIRFLPDFFVYHIQGASIRQRRAEMIISSHRSFIHYFAKYNQSWLHRTGTKLSFFLLLIGTLPRLIITTLWHQK